MGAGGIGPGRTRSVSERLKAATDELQKLEQLVLSGDCSPRVLGDFRGAVDSIRQTAWAVQQWTELRQQNRDPYSVMGVLAEERVRRATQLTKDLTIDLEALELSLETPGWKNCLRRLKGYMIDWHRCSGTSRCNRPRKSIEYKSDHRG